MDLRWKEHKNKIKVNKLQIPALKSAKNWKEISKSAIILRKAHNGIMTKTLWIRANDVTTSVSCALFLPVGRYNWHNCRNNLHNNSHINLLQHKQSNQSMSINNSIYIHYFKVHCIYLTQHQSLVTSISGLWFWLTKSFM